MQEYTAGHPKIGMPCRGGANNNWFCPVANNAVAERHIFEARPVVRPTDYLRKFRLEVN